MLDAYLESVDRTVHWTHGNKWLPIVMFIWCTPILLPFAIVGMFIRKDDDSDVCIHDWLYTSSAEGGTSYPVEPILLNSFRVCELCGYTEKRVEGKSFWEKYEP